MVVQEEETNMVATLHNPQPGAQQRKLAYVQGVEEHCIRVAASTAQHMTRSVPTVIRWAILPEFAEADRDHTSRYHSMTALNPQPMPFAYSHLREITYSYITLQEARLNQHPQSVSR